MTTLRFTLRLGFDDDRPGPFPGDDEGELTFIVPNGLPPADGSTQEFAC